MKYNILNQHKANWKNKAQYTVNLAVSHHRAGNYAKAEELYKKLLSFIPGNAEILHLIGRAKYQAGKYDAVIKYIARAILINPSRDDFYINLGAALDAVGRLDEAVKAYKQALSFK